ncbi:hypothetical protein Ndes2526B_g09315 [Nannochloris sp. 'desiccata']|nr:hypothetical protein KSW81_003655 [Chlorella desiccata (nom. nud.)]KAH7616002.1 hypothetical protein NADE_000837 [Chlorella desiccata (nom. nud.)]
MSDSMLTTTQVVSQAVQSGPKATILGDLTNIGSPKKISLAAKSGTVNPPTSSSPLLLAVPPSSPLVKEHIIIGNSDIDVESDSEVFDEADLLGFDIEDALFAAHQKKPSKKNKAKAAYRSSNSPRHEKFVKKRKAVGLASKAKQKQRSVQLTKDIACKEAIMEANLGIDRRVFEESPIISSTEIVVRAQRPEKAVADVEIVNFDECVIATPELPSLLPIALSENQFELLDLATEEENTPAVEPSRIEGIVTRVINTVKRVVAKVKRAVVKFAKKAVNSAKNIVSL